MQRAPARRRPFIPSFAPGGGRKNHRIIRIRTCYDVVLFFIYTPEATNKYPVFTGGPGAAPGGVASKNGQEHMRVHRGSFPIAHDACACVFVSVCVSPLKWQLEN